MKPPMVGVPAFSSTWRATPSSRIGWPRPWRWRIQRMKRLPMATATSWPVNSAAPVRKVRYLRRLKPDQWTWCCSRKAHSR